MRFFKIKKDDETFGHKAGDLFLLEVADYDPEKRTGFKVKLELLDHSFYGHQVKATSIGEIIAALAEPTQEGT